MFFWIFSKRKRRALKFCEDLSNFQPVNSDLRPFGEKKDNVLFCSFYAFWARPVLSCGTITIAAIIVGTINFVTAWITVAALIVFGIIKGIFFFR